MNTDVFGLTRFLEAQQRQYAAALKEMREGGKRTHWIWFVFPQLSGLGRSAYAQQYGLTGLAEARAYLAHPVLGLRLREATEAMLAHQAMGAVSVLGPVDAVKFRSCLTLFSLAAPGEPLFSTALECFFAGECDLRTLQLLEAQGDA
jgi:uncharacterized protein (DUF1810 family)